MDYNAIEFLYNTCLYLDAYAQCEHIYKDRDTRHNLTARQMLLLGRLADRLGGQDLFELFFQSAREKFPDNPMVRYYAGRTDESGKHPLFRLREIEEFCVDELETNSDKAVWHATSAWMYARFRDFDRAHDYLKRAKEFQRDKAWIMICEAEVFLLSDDWEAALKTIDTAWQMAPGHPQAAAVLGKVYARFDRIEDAADKILSQAVEGQSYQTLLMGLWYLCAHAERTAESENSLTLMDAKRLADRLEALAPLAETQTRGDFAKCRIDIAWLQNDHPTMQEQLKTVQHPFYKTILENLAQNPEKPLHQTRYKVVYQKHNTCLPASTAAVLGGLDRTVDLDKLAEQMTYQGTAIWRMVEWLHRQDLVVSPFIATPELTTALLKKGIAFVFIQKGVTYYHAMAAVGWDESTGVLILHDPDTIRLERMLVSKIGWGEAPFGPEALAIVSAERQTDLDWIPVEAVEPFEAFLEYQKIEETEGAVQAGRVVERLQAAYPEHPFCRRLEAFHLATMGQPGSAAEVQEQLLSTFPECEHLKNELLDNLAQTGNSALQRNILEQLVKKKKLPGMMAREEWHYPPAEYVMRYADYLGLDQSGYAESKNLLWDTLGREPYHAGCYHVLGDVHHRAGNYAKALLPYYCAAHLNLENHHYVRAYCDALHRLGQGDTGIAFLKKRTEKLKTTLRGGDVWGTLISALEAHGYPDEAMAETVAACERYPQDPSLHEFAVGFWSRLGFWDKAYKSLAAVSKTGRRAYYFSAYIDYYRRKGEWAKALALTETWVKEEPNNLNNLGTLASLIAQRDGRQAALKLTAGWMTDHPGNDYLEELHYNYLNELFRYNDKIQLLRSRIRRNRYDAWAYRELGFCLLSELESGRHRDNVELAAELDQVLNRCKEICPDHPVLYGLLAETKAGAGEFGQAVQYAVRAFELDPQYDYAYRRAWEWANDLSDAEQFELFRKMEQNLFRCSGFLSVARDIAPMYAERFGTDEAHTIVDKWLRKFPDDPEIVAAKADLLLDYGKGRSDAEKAVTLLESETACFPSHSGLRSALSRAYRILLKEDKWIASLQEMLRLEPLNFYARRQMADYYQNGGEPQLAITLLKEGLALSPLNEGLRYDLIALLFQIKDTPTEAIIEIEAGLRLVSESVQFRRQLIELLFEYGEEERAVEIAEEGVKTYPDGAALWYSLACALWRSRYHTDMQTVEAYLRKALSLNPRYYDAADSLAELLTYRKRYDEAGELIQAQMKFQADPAPIHTRIAWITRHEGNDDEAKSQLTALVQKWPRSNWAWRLLLKWITEDEDWERTGNLLKNVHPVMMADPIFTGDKLTLLAEAGLSDTATEREWDEILHNFPENERIHTQRYDLLIEKGKRSKAFEILKILERFHKASPYVISRKAVFQLEENQLEDAIASAMKVWQSPVDVSDWCHEHIWEEFSRKGHLPRLIQTALDKWENGAFIEQEAFHSIIKGMDALYPSPGWGGQILAKIGISTPLEQHLARLLKISPQRDTQDGYYTYSLLDKLDSMNQKRKVSRFGRRNRVFCKSKTKVWQIIGHAFLTVDNNQAGRARKWFENWRERNGCELWAVSNYIISIEKSLIRPKKKFGLIYENCIQAIEVLPQDHTLKYMVAKACEAALRLKNDQDFLALVNPFEKVLQDSDADYWMAHKDQNLAKVVLLFRDVLLSRNESEAIRNAEQFIADLPLMPSLGWIRRHLFKRLRKHMCFPTAFKFWLRLTF